MPDEGGKQGLRYSQWRPIGVCDQGKDHQRMAKMFSKRDFIKVMGPGINRQNWRNHREVEKIVERYAKQVAKLSLLTKTMNAPKIGKISLVGAVLGHEKTPGLNVESVDGRVQFFQVEFYDAAVDKHGKSHRRRLYWIMAGLLSAGVFMFLNWVDIPPISLKSGSGKSRTPLCENRDKPRLHRKEMRRLRRDLIAELDRFPNWSRLQEVRRLCAGVAGSLEEQEQLLVRCLLNTKRETQTLGTHSYPDLQQMEKCAKTLCRTGDSYLSPFCNQL